MNRVKNVLKTVDDVLRNNPMVTFNDFDGDNFVTVTTSLKTALGRDSANAFDAFVSVLRMHGIDNALDMAIAMRFTHLDDTGTDLVVTFHPSDNKHLLRLAADDVADGVTVLTKKSDSSRVRFPVSLAVL